jgi:hypothetical protein
MQLLPRLNALLAHLESLRDSRETSASDDDAVAMDDRELTDPFLLDVLVGNDECPAPEAESVLESEQSDAALMAEDLITVRCCACVRSYVCVCLCERERERMSACVCLSAYVRALGMCVCV